LLILNTLLPHEEHWPAVAGLPFFMCTILASLISVSLRHFMQKAFMGLFSSL